MTQDTPIVVDHSQEEATQQVLPNANLLYSCKTALTGMYLEYHYSPPHETPEHYPNQHVIAIQTEGAVQSERKLDGQFRQEYIVAGDICVVPAHTRHWIRSQDEQGLILLSFDPAFLGKVAHESVEIIPHFAKSDPLIHQIGINLKTALQADPMSSQVYAESLGVALAAHLMRYYAAEKRTLQISTNIPQASIQQAIDYINDNLTENLSLLTIATTVGMSQYHFCRVFKKATGLTPWQYVVQQRIAAAKRLLAQPLSIAEISLRLGFANQNQFATFFRKHTGVPPRQYRQGL
ncbi:AraC family transcriptional regulator [Iningainema tapete]|uniref:Helix-turn-helix domain-containing protein n=1 Tax=Iningainema tapete BLCC-T55 TaxID=2748662 RepID=A0A8J6XBV6_9CYAN|nr:AraC family transcriptional regulator [Iningainema tapete]MBD2771969.1 helix-turn-helix domain-containing protein [Iningainema tapete BLCC-T55]